MPLLKEIPSGLNHGVGDAAPRGDRVAAWVPCDVADRVGQLRRGRGSSRECGRNLFPGMGHPIGGVARVHARDVEGDLAPFLVAADELLRARDRALDGVHLDDDVGGVTEHFLLFTDGIAVGRRRLSERGSCQPLGAGQQLALRGERTVVRGRVAAVLARGREQVRSLLEQAGSG